MDFVIIFFSLFGIPYAIGLTWTMYLCVMTLKRHKDRLTLPAKLFAYPILVIGYITDVLFNLIVGSLAFFEPPKELLFTTRCTRHLADKGWRGHVARWFCRHFLDPFDPDGKHCG